MIALRLHDKGDLRLHEEPVPTPGDDEVLVRVTAVGLCGSDLHWFNEGAIGDVVSQPSRSSSVTSSSASSKPESGRTSGLRSTRRSRAAGAARASPATRTSVSRAGSPATRSTVRLRSRLAWPERLAHRLPDSLPDAEASLLEPLGVALHALDLGRVQAGDDGGRVRLRPDRSPARPTAAACGRGRRSWQPTRSRTASRPRRRSARPWPWRRGGPARRSCPRRSAGGVDVAFEVAGEDDAIATAIDTLRPGGRLVLVGIPTDDRSCFTASTARRKGLTISLCRRMKAERPSARDRARRDGPHRAELARQRAVSADQRIRGVRQR